MTPVYIYTHTHIQGVSRLVDFTAGGDFLGLCDKKFYINMSPILDSYGVMDIKLQRATHAVHNRAGTCVVASGGIFEN